MSPDRKPINVQMFKKRGDSDKAKYRDDLVFCRVTLLTFRYYLLFSYIYLLSSAFSSKISIIVFISPNETSSARKLVSLTNTAMLFQLNEQRVLMMVFHEMK